MTVDVQSCYLWYVVYKYSLLSTKTLGQVFLYAANCICKQHTIDNTRG